MPKKIVNCLLLCVMRCCGGFMHADVPTIDELLALPAAVTYKADARSTVWRVDAPAGAFVLKRYEYPPLRQRLGRWLGMHPGQRERRGVQRLQNAGIAVAEVQRHAVRRGRYVQATAHGGPCLQALLGETAWEADERRAPTLRDLAAATAKLLAAGLVHRDLKVGNVLVRDDGRVVLIDVGAVRPSRSMRRRRATLWILFHTLGKASRSAQAAERDAAALAAGLLEAGVDRELLPDEAAQAVDSRHE